MNVDMELMRARLLRAWRSKTILFALLLSLAGYMQAERQLMQPLVDKLPDDWRPIVWPLIGLMFAFLRFITTKPLEEK